MADLPDSLFLSDRLLAHYVQYNDSLYHKAAAELRRLHAENQSLRAALVQQAEPVCKCDLRTRLVGDGCEVCNPELAAELAQQQRKPLTEEEKQTIHNETGAGHSLICLVESYINGIKEKA